jgi:hypothetical protein
VQRTSSLASALVLACALAGCDALPGGEAPPPDQVAADQVTANLVAAAEGAEPAIAVTAAGTLTVLGAVRDKDAMSQHLPIPGVKITMTGAATGTAFTNSDGVYRFQNLPAGTYTLAASKAGATFTPSPRTFSITSSTVRGFDCTAGCGAATAAGADFKELVIVDPRVTGDARASNAQDGPWSFRFLMEQMAPAGADPADFVQTWMNGFLSSAGPIAGFPVENRNTSAVLDPATWPRKNGKLDLAKAPFQLLAIVNRTDLHRAGNGEARFVFGMKTDATAPGGSFEAPFTVIFEYRLPVKTPAGAAISRLDWIRKFNALASMSFGSAYNAALQKVTDQFTRAGTTSGAVNGSSISQVRTNEIQMGGPWQLREFHLLADASGKGVLRLVPVAQTPDDTKNGQMDLASYLRSQRVNIVGGFATVPAALVGGQSDENFVPWAFPNFPDIAEQTRKTFAGQTCNGCHNVETNQIGSFYQITPNSGDTGGQVTTGQERLSGFIKDIEIPRRRRFVQNRLSCAADLSDCSPGAEPLVLPAFAPIQATAEAE